VKLENVMRTRTGRVVVMDFGIATAMKAEESEGLAGTLAYMAPEVLQGANPDARSDIFAAGLVLSEMIGSDRALDAESRRRIQQGARANPPQLPEGPWQRVLERAVSVDPEQRYASVREMSRALEEVTPRVEGVEDKTPYPGLASFTDADTEFFFGREAEVESLWKKLQRSHLLAVIGASGAGKTSFLQAGLVPTRPEGWRAILCQPGSNPFSSLARALTPQFTEEADAGEKLLDGVVVAAATHRDVGDR
jgi:serine/threonine protein kinase